MNKKINKKLVLMFIKRVQNYGNEKDAFELLYPNRHVFRGIDNNDFETLVNPSDVIEIIKSIKSTLK